MLASELGGRGFVYYETFLFEKDRTVSHDTKTKLLRNLPIPSQSKLNTQPFLFLFVYLVLGMLAS